MESKTILIVEDELEIVQILEKQLLDNGYQSISANDHSVANQKLMNQTFDLILMDLKIPQGSGVDLVKMLRSKSDHPNYKTPILVVSGALDETILNELAKKIQGIIMKPWRRETLLSAIKKVLQV